MTVPAAEEDWPTASEDDQGTSRVLAEATLVGRAQDGDLAAFETLVRRYQAPILRLASRILLDHAEAEDAVQETFVLVWRRLPSLADPAAFRGWLYAIATRCCLSLLRTRQRRATLPADEETLVGEQDSSRAGLRLAGAEEDDPALATEHAERRRSLDAALAELPEDQRVCWVLRELHDLGYDDIGRATGLPVSTVRGRIARARQNLARGMSAWR